MTQYNRKATGDLHGIATFSIYKNLKIVDDIKIRKTRIGGSHHKNGRRKDPKKGS